MFNKYFEEELHYLREMGHEFAQAYPGLAHLLGSAGMDPDVERLLEGTAFLTGRIRQKLDDEFPELVQAMMQLISPNYLRPVPATSIIRFKALPDSIRAKTVIKKGTAVQSVPVQGIPCTFKTTADVNLYPLTLTLARIDNSPRQQARFDLTFSLPAGSSLADINLTDLRLQLHGQGVLPASIFYWLCTHTSSIKISSQDAGITIAPDKVQPAGLSPQEALLPYPVNGHHGYRLLQEYLVLPQKFICLDLLGLKEAHKLPQANEFKISFCFDATPPFEEQDLTKNISLFCCPVINLFSHESEPIRVDHSRSSYQIYPLATKSEHYNIHSADKVVGYLPGSAQEKEYYDFFSFSSEQNNLFYLSHKENILGNALPELQINFVDLHKEPAVPQTETIGIQLTCSNSLLPEKLNTGDIKRPTAQSPEYAVFENICPVTRPVAPPTQKYLYWLLIAHWNLNCSSLASKDSLQKMFKLYDFHAFIDRRAARSNDLRIKSIENVNIAADEYISQGRLIRGSKIDIELDEDNFTCEGDIYLLGTILGEVLGCHTSLNSYIRLQITGLKSKEIFSWLPKSGNKNLL